MIVNGLDFRKTCDCSPEQYDVFDSDGHLVGYVRLRWGGLSCQYPDVGGEDIYCADIGNAWTGCFENEQQRTYHLSRIANKILARINRERFGMSESDRRDAVGRVMSCLEDGYLDLAANCSETDRDDLEVIKEAMELLIKNEGSVADD